MKDKYTIYLLGYTQFGHTNHFPWKKFYEVFKHLGYNIKWVEQHDIGNEENRIFICWDEPSTVDLINNDIYKSGDIILHKLVCMSKYDKGVNWGTTKEEAEEFFKTWRFSLHKIFEDAYDGGYNIYSFGAKTNPKGHLEKERILNKLKDRYFPVPWGSSLYSYDEVQNCKPKMDGLQYDIGFVGSIWGQAGRGNVDSIQAYLEPLLNEYTSDLGGPGTKRSYVDDPTHKMILENARICPIINAMSWKVEKGLMDRFWTVFTAGRFGVVDSEGVYDFFNEDEFVYASSAEEYIDKTKYYIKNVDKQLPFIEKVQKRIREEYNWYHTWDNILKTVIKEN